jgi:hypothetical protein
MERAPAEPPQFVITLRNVSPTAANDPRLPADIAEQAAAFDAQLPDLAAWLNAQWPSLSRDERMAAVANLAAVGVEVLANGTPIVRVKP